jgi:hypothetical protein
MKVSSKGQHLRVLGVWEKAFHFFLINLQCKNVSPSHIDALEAT